MANLASSIQGPWIILGDFNAIISSHEFSRGEGRAIDRVSFGNWINMLGLIDMGFSGSHFTWSRGVSQGNHILRQLDQVLCNMEGRLFWPDGTVRHLERVYSDHAPILVNLWGSMSRSTSSKPFRFMAAWFSHSKFPELVENEWHKVEEFSTKLTHLAQKLQGCIR